MTTAAPGWSSQRLPGDRTVYRPLICPKGFLADDAYVLPGSGRYATPAGAWDAAARYLAPPRRSIGQRLRGWFRRSSLAGANLPR